MPRCGALSLLQKTLHYKGGVIVAPMPMPEAPRMYLIVVYRPLPAAPLVVRYMYMAVVPGPMPATVASRYC